jgi:chemotaxis protein methyltransferase CheR
VRLPTERPQLRLGDALNPPSLGAGEFEQLRQLAYREFGLDLKEGKQELVTARLRNLVQGGGFGTFHAYYRHVVSDSTGQSLARMIDALVTNHTAFYREPDHFDFLKNHVLPQFARRDPLEIWSAACSTGEEVWTLLCLLNEAMPGRRVRVVGSDISNRVLAFAAQALYPVERCHGMPAGWLSRYFAPEPGISRSYRVLPKHRMQASFERLNLIAPHRASARFPVIFCRNVMIYFDRSTQEKVIQYLSERLEPQGYLFVGHAESLARVSHGLEYVRPAVYRKTAER